MNYKNTGLEIKIKKILIYFLLLLLQLPEGSYDFVMSRSDLKPEDFPSEILPYTDTLFLISGISQIFFAIPDFGELESRWHIIGICWTLFVARIASPNTKFQV